MIIVRYEEDSIGGIPPIDLAGIKDIREQKNDSPDVYPNPVSEILNIATINPGSEIRIFDLYGKTVLNVVCNAPEFSFNVQELPSGIYIAAIITKEGKMITKRFVKI